MISTDSSLATSARTPRPAFRGGGDFYHDVKRDVDAYLAQANVRRRALIELNLKAMISFGLLIGSWAYLIVDRPNVVVGIVMLGVLTCGFILVGFLVLHDANHGAFFRSRRANHLLGWTADVFLGFGSFAWRVKHNLAHHTYPNVGEYDDDIQQAPLARLAAFQEPLAWYRWQHMYMWLFYAFLVLRWHIGNDLGPFRRRRVARSNLPLPRGWDLAGLLIGRLVFIGWVFVIPMLFYTWWIVICAYVGVCLVSGTVLAVTLQLAHCVEETAFVSAEEIESEVRYWAQHEVEATVDFCHDNRVLAWLIGGLNYQIEHHLFPQLPHPHYARIAPIVAHHAQRHGVRYVVQPSLAAALRSHYRHLRTMGQLGARPEMEMG